MKHLAFAFFVFVFGPQEPTFPGCPSCGVRQYVDIPSTSVTLSNAELLAGASAFEGWGFECQSGQTITRVDLYVENDAHPGFWLPVDSSTSNAYNVQPYSRPDVQAAAAGMACPGAAWNSTAGWIRYIRTPLPLGAHRFQVLAFSGPYHGSSIVTLNVVP